MMARQFDLWVAYTGNLTENRTFPSGTYFADEIPDGIIEWALDRQGGQWLEDYPLTEGLPEPVAETTDEASPTSVVDLPVEVVEALAETNPPFSLSEKATAKKRPVKD